MSWCVYYNYKGEIRGMSISRLQERLEDLNESIKDIKQTILSLMVMAPPASGTITDDNGVSVLWADYVSDRLEVLWSDLNDAMFERVKIQQALFTKELKPDDVYEG